MPSLRKTAAAKEGVGHFVDSDELLEAAEWQDADARPECLHAISCRPVEWRAILHREDSGVPHGFALNRRCRGFGIKLHPDHATAEFAFAVDGGGGRAAVARPQTIVCRAFHIGLRTDWIVVRLGAMIA